MVAQVRRFVKDCTVCAEIKSTNKASGPGIGEETVTYPHFFYRKIPQVNGWASLCSGGSFLKTCVFEGNEGGHERCCQIPD